MVIHAVIIGPALGRINLPIAGANAGKSVGLLDRGRDVGWRVGKVCFAGVGAYHKKEIL